MSYSKLLKNTLAANVTSGLILALGAPEVAAVTNFIGGVDYLQKADQYVEMPKGAKIATVAALAVGNALNAVLARKYKAYRVMWYVGSAISAGVLAAAHTEKGREICAMVDQAVEAMKLQTQPVEETVPAQ